MHDNLYNAKVLHGEKKQRACIFVPGNTCMSTASREDEKPACAFKVKSADPELAPRASPACEIQIGVASQLSIRVERCGALIRAAGRLSILGLHRKMMTPLVVHEIVLQEFSPGDLLLHL